MARAALWILVVGTASCAAAPMPAQQSAPPQSTPPQSTPPQSAAPQSAAPETSPVSTADEQAPSEEPAPLVNPPREQLRSPEGLAGPGWVHGSLAASYRGRFTDDDKDQNLRGVLALDVADPNTPWIKGYFLARMDIDVDGLDEGQLLQDLSNTYDGAVVSHLYLAYADLALDKKTENSASILRLGRQSDAHLPAPLRLDGATYIVRPKKENDLEIGMYAGIPVHLYESSYGGDRAFGTFLEGKPWTSGWARFDYMHLEDELVLGDQRDDLLSLKLWQEVTKRWRFEGEFSHVENNPRDVRLTSLYQDAESETNLRASYYQLLETQKQNVTELDPYYTQLLEYEPFREGTIDVSQALGKHALVDVGVDVRRVISSADVGEFNRDWQRYFVTATLRELAGGGLSVSCTADFWDGDDQDTNSLGADVSYEVEKGWKTSVGTYYSLYKYELLELAERDDVRTYYIRAGRALSSRLDFDMSYELENDDLETYHTLRLGILWRF